MPLFDIKRYYDDNRDYYGDASLDDVAKDAYAQDGWDKQYPSYDDFKKQVGIADQVEYDSIQRAEAAKKAQPTGVLRRLVGDPLVSAAKGVVGLGEAAVGLANVPTMGYVGKGLEALGYRPKSAQESLEGLYSNAQQEANLRVQQAKGFLPTVTEAVKNPSTIAHSVIESVPSMLGGFGIGRKVLTSGLAGASKLAPAIAGAMGEGAVTTGSSAEAIRQETESGTLSPVQVLASTGSGIATALIGVAGGKLARRFGLDDIDALGAGGKTADILDPKTLAKKKNIFRRVIESAISEGAFEELPQSMQEQMLQNVALGKPAGEGVAEAGAQGMLAGFFMGGGAPFMQGGSGRKQAVDLNAVVPPVAPPPPAGPISGALQKAGILPKATDTDIAGVTSPVFQESLRGMTGEVNRMAEAERMQGRGGPRTLAKAALGVPEGITAKDLLMGNEFQPTGRPSTAQEAADVFQQGDTMRPAMQSADVMAEAINRGELQAPYVPDADTGEGFRADVAPRDIESLSRGDLVKARTLMEQSGRNDLLPVIDDQLELKNLGIDRKTRDRLNLMQQDVNAAEGIQRGQTDDGKGGMTGPHIIGSDYPAFFRDLNKQFKREKPEYINEKGETSKLTGLDKKAFNQAIDRYRSGEPTTGRDDLIFSYLKRIAPDYVDMSGDVVMGDQDYIEEIQSKGFEPVKGLPIQMTDLNPGDKFIIDGEEFEFKDFDDKGNAVIEDGRTYRVDPFDTFQADGLKQGEQKPVGKRRDEYEDTEDWSARAGRADADTLDGVMEPGFQSDLRGMAGEVNRMTRAEQMQNRGGARTLQTPQRPVEVPATEPKAVERNVWEMTPDEFDEDTANGEDLTGWTESKEYGITQKLLKRSDELSKKNDKESQRKAEYLVNKAQALADTYFESNNHKTIVEKAYKEGKPVPQSNIDLYGLSKQTAPKPQQATIEPKAIPAQAPKTPIDVGTTVTDGTRTGKAFRGVGKKMMVRLDNPGDGLKNVFLDDSWGAVESAKAKTESEVVKNEGEKTETEALLKKSVHDHSNTQVDLPKEASSDVITFGNKIPESEIYTDPKDPSYGREKEPHVTVRYGMDTTDPKEIAPAFEGMAPIKAKMGKVSIFETDKYDVVKVEIESDDLKKANKRVGETVELPGETFKDYQPHATIAYVKKGEGKKYVGDKTFVGKEITIDKITLVAKDGKKHVFELNGKPETKAGTDVKDVPSGVDQDAKTIETKLQELEFETVLGLKRLTGIPKDRFDAAFLKLVKDGTIQGDKHADPKQAAPDQVVVDGDTVFVGGMIRKGAVPADKTKPAYLMTQFEFGKQKHENPHWEKTYAGKDDGDYLRDVNATHEKIVKAALRSGELSREDYKRLHEEDYGPLPKLTKAEAPAKAETVSESELERVGLLRDFRGRWQWKGSIESGWMTSNTKDGAVEMATKAYLKADKKDLLSREERGAKANKERYDRIDANFRKTSIPDLEKRLASLDGVIKSLQTSPEREFNGRGGVRNGPALANEGARQAGQEKLDLRFYIEERKKLEGATAFNPDTAIEDHNAFLKKLYEGDTTPDEIKTRFKAVVDNADAIKAVLTKKTKAELLKMMGGYRAARYKSETKLRVVNAAYSDMVGAFSMGEAIGYNMMTETETDAIAKIVNSVTNEKIKAFAEKVVKQRAEHSERVGKVVKAIENPKTLEDYKTFIEYKGKDKLSDAQKVEYEDLIAIDQKGKLTSQRAATSEIKAAGVTVGADIIETKHTKLGHDLFVVKLAERVERDEYNKLNTAAKKLGGSYSSYRGNGAVPGFQFKTREAAEAFQKIAAEGDTTAAKEITEGRTENKKAGIVKRLNDMADTMEAKANESLGRDRLANTAKRARQASSADDDARATIRLAQTMRNLAGAIESGEATHLDGVKFRSHVELLDELTKAANYEYLRQKYPIYAEREQHKEEPATIDAAQFAKYPKWTISEDSQLKFIDQLKKADGYKNIGAKLEKIVKGSGETWMPVPNELTLELYSKIKGDTPNRFDAPWTLDSQAKTLNQLKSLGLETPEMLRAAIREYVQFRGAKPKVDRVKELERGLSGQKSVGVDFFPTPKAVADDMAERLDIQPGMDVLEPSAGNGNLADAVKRAEPGANIDTVEMSGTLREILQEKGYPVVAQDFMDMATDKQYDRIIMNPPFSDGQDADHIMKAYDMLKPGGKMVAISGEGIFFRTDKKSVAFREWLEDKNAETEKMEKAFTDRTMPNTTGVNARMIVIEKPSGVEVAGDDIPFQTAKEQGKPKGMPVKEIETGLENQIAKSAFPVVVFDGSDDPKVSKYRANLKAKEANGELVKGFYYDGKAFINAQGAVDLEGAALTLLHENVGHGGVETFLGDDFNPFLDMLNRHTKYHPGVAEVGKKRGYNMDTEKGRRRAAAEWFAQSIENNTLEPNLWTRFLKILKDALRKMGIDIKFGDAELAEVVRGAYKAATKRMPTETKDGIKINYVGKDVLGRAFGLWDGKEIFVRNDLPEAIQRFVASHEEYHSKDVTSGNWLTSEIKANLFPGIKDPVGLIKTIFASLSPERLSLYKDRIVRGDKGVSLAGKAKDGINEFAQDISYSLSKAKAAILDNAAFRKWFGDSKVVDESGNPLVVYHGTDKSGWSIANTDNGFFATPNTEMASLYTEPRMSHIRLFKSRKTGDAKIRAYEKQASKSVYPLYLNMKKPLDIRSIGRHLPLVNGSIAYDRETNSGTKWLRDILLSNNTKQEIIDAAQKVDNYRSYDYPNRSIDDVVESILRHAGIYELGVYKIPERLIGAGKEYVSKNLKKFLQELGYDGIIFRDNVKDSYGRSLAEGDTYAVFEPTQIKSIWDTKFDPENPDIRYSFAGEKARTADTALTATDKTYLKAVESGDMSAAEKIVAKAAADAGYTVGPVYHGTKNDFSKFDITRSDAEEKGFFFTTSQKKASRYGDRVMSAFLSMSNPYKITQREWTRGTDIGLDEAKNQGYDGYIVKGLEGRETFITFDPNQIKSAEAVVRDDTGQIIPPSKRFNPEVDDIRFSLADDQEGTLKAADGYIKYIKGKPDLNQADLSLSVPLYSFRKVKQLWQAFTAASDSLNDKHAFQRELMYSPDGAVAYPKAMERFKKDHPEEYEKVFTRWMVDNDVNKVGYRVKFDTDTLKYRLVAPSKDWQTGSFSTEDDAWKQAVPWEAEAYLKQKGATQDGAEALIMARTIGHNMFGMLFKEMKAVIEKAEAEDKPVPEIAWYDAENKTVQISLKQALMEMGDLRGTYFPRSRPSGKYVLSATKKGEHPERHHFDLAVEFKDAKDWKSKIPLPINRKANELKAKGYSVTIDKAESLPESVFVELSGHSVAVETLVNTALEQLSKKTVHDLGDIKIQSKWHGDDFIIYGAGVNAKEHPDVLEHLGGEYGYVESGKGGYPQIVFKNADKARIENDVKDAIMDHERIKLGADLMMAESLVMTIADIYKSRGARSHMVKRLEAVGKDVWKGYEEDPIIAFTRAAQGIAGSTAKGKLAHKLYQITTGRTQTWAEFQETNPDAKYRDYLEDVKEKRVDPAKQQNAYNALTGYTKDLLRNDEALDRVIGTMKGIAVLKYLAGRISSPLVNLSALVTSVPGIMTGIGKIPLTSVPRLLGRAMADYRRYKFQDGKDLDDWTLKTLEYIEKNGWDNPQYNHEALGVLKGKLGQKYDKFMDWSMMGFTVTEKINRASTILGTYLGIKEQHKGSWTEQNHLEALEKAKEVSDKAHGVYGKINYPEWARGGGLAGNIAKSFYVFRTFSHNYMLAMKELGFDKQYKAMAYMLVSPAVVAGAGASVAMPVISGILKAFGYDDEPEEDFYALMESMFGDTGEQFARTGLFGMGGKGAALKGSLQIGVLDLPTSIKDILGAPGSVVQDVYYGMKNIGAGNYMKGAEQITPSAVGSVIRGVRENTEGVTTRTNTPVFYGKDQLKLDMVEAALRTLSFNPARVAAIRDVQRADDATTRRFRDMSSEIYARAKKLFLKPVNERSEADMLDIVERMNKYNSAVTANPRYSFVPKMTWKSIMSNVKQAMKPTKRERERAKREMVNESS